MLSYTIFTLTCYRSPPEFRRWKGENLTRVVVDSFGPDLSTYHFCTFLSGSTRPWSVNSLSGRIWEVGVISRVYVYVLTEVRHSRLLDESTRVELTVLIIKSGD